MDEQTKTYGSVRWVMLGVLCASLLLVAMDATILNVALPSLIDDLHVGPLEQLWIIDIYGLVLGGLLITTGALGDRWGRKLLFISGFLLFGVASVIAATAGSAAQLIVGRVLLGIGGAMVMPSTLSLIRNIFTDVRERTMAIGIWAAVAGVGATVGPIVGGFLVEHFGWSSAFWLNVPVVLVTVVVGLWVLPEYRTPQAGRLDWFSAVLSVAGIVCLAWGIKHLAKGEATVVDWAMLLIGVGALAWFARRQLRSADPLLDVRLFRNGAFTAAAVATLLAMMAIGAAMFLISLWLQYVHGYSPSQAGIRMLPAALTLLTASLLTPMLMEKFGVRVVLGVGLGAVALGFLLLAVSPEPTSYPVVALVLVSFGLGDGMAVTAAAAVLVGAVPADRAGQAGAVEETNYEVGVGFGVALLGSLHARLFTEHMTDLPVPADRVEQASGSVGGAAEVASDLPEPARTELLGAATHAFDSALTTTSYLSAAVVALVTVGAVWLVPKGFRVSGGH
ncbi:MFS transporter [Nocardia rosealba]|uniref:MFS transporter n=1 Tax=Nocardia TaxID=1817 RepID=UPI001CD9CAFB|nr:MFS transporter [Nocardia rosealba]MCA2205532.1 MFS transporter [Nocardia rosealba]